MKSLLAILSALTLGITTGNLGSLSNVNTTATKINVSDAKTQQNTKYIDKNGQIQETNAKDLSNINSKEVTQIGFYQNEQGEIQVVQMPKTIEKVPEILPSEITSLKNMFFSTEAFNQDISTWDTSNVINMSYMFYNARVFNQDISKWNTANVTNMSSMFASTGAFNQDISVWDTANVINMSYIFFSAGAFNKDISTWDTANVTNMIFMFFSASIFNQDISTWDTANVTNMSYMFAKAKAFNQDISKWNVNKVTQHIKFAIQSGIDDDSKLPEFLE